MPCKILPNIYGFIDKSVFEVILSTCNKTEIPPNPSKNAENKIFIESIFIWIFEINEIPFVISKIPVKNGVIKFVGICNKLNDGITIFDNIPNTLLVFNIEIITENNTTKPPIKSIVEVAFFMLVAITSPKLENVTVFDF